MEPTGKKNGNQAPQGGNYGSYNAGYGYGYGYGGYGGETVARRSFHDYLLILRERLWYIVLAFLVVFASVAVYTFNQTKIYQSRATVQILRSDKKVMQVQGVSENEIRSADDLNTQVKVLESPTIVQKVAEKLTGADLEAFRAPYEKSGLLKRLSVFQILEKDRSVVPQRLSLVIDVLYKHPDPRVAMVVTNLFVDEYMNYNADIRVDESMKAVYELKGRAEEQRRKVDELARNLQSYRERNKLISLDQRKDIVTESLKALNVMVTQSTAHLRESEVRWNQVQERLQKGLSLLDLPFISGQQIGSNSTTLVSQLTQQLASQKIAVAQLRDRYREKHPKMVEAANSLAQTERELVIAVNAAAAAVKSNYESALRNDKETRAQLASMESESLALDRHAVDYSNLERDYRINEQLLQGIISRMTETSTSSGMDTQNARVIAKAYERKKPISPNVPLNLGLGLIGGLGLGLAFAFFIAYIDDRVKSSYDIETVVGLPILGIIPEIKKFDQPDRAIIVTSHAERQVEESFLSIHSTLRLKDEAKNAKVILTTSTVPGEGKSFTTTNLALVFASHGEKVIVVDCDLRKPNIHRSFRKENNKGLIDVALGSAKLDDCIIHGVHSNLDLLVSGGRAKNPTQILNSKAFEQLIQDLRARYDRVFIDTPPLAAVSDAMIVLPLCDGSLFTIFFNRVRRKAAQFAAQKLLEANVPSFGAILNGLNLSVSGYYYAQYYDKTYKDYYVTQTKQDPDSKER